MKELWKNKKELIIAGVVLAILAIVAIIIYAGGNDDRLILEKIQLANNTALEGDYEQAAILYEELLTIDSQNEQVEKALESIYLTMADDFAKEEDYQSAIDTLDNCLKKSDELGIKLTSVSEKSEEYKAIVAKIAAEEEERQKEEEKRQKGEALVAEGYDFLAGTNGSKKDLQKAIACFEEADSLDNLTGSFLAGYSYDTLENGDSINADCDKAVTYYEKCADVNPMANICLGRYYCEKDVATCEKYYDKAIEMIESGEYDLEEFPYAYSNCLGSLYNSKDNGEKAMPWFEKGVEAGSVCSMYNLGLIYIIGECVEQDVEKGVEWVAKAAESGYPNGMRFYGYCYMEGIVVKKDKKLGFEWYEKAAEAGNLDAMKDCGDCYAMGIGVEISYPKALDYYEMAANAGYVAAYGLAGSLYYDGIGVEQNYSKAMNLFEKGAEAGDVMGMYCLGMCYYYGNGTDKDLTKAKEWFDKAVENGCMWDVPKL